MTVKSGPDHVPVSRFRRLDSAKAMPTNDTSGPLFTHSSPSAALQRSLESKLRQAMDANGSPEYALTWKMWDMPAGVPICALRGSVRRISDSASSGWRSPDARTGRGGVTSSPEVALQRLAAGHTLNLEDQVQFAGWPTPNAEHQNDTDTKWQERREALRAQKKNGNGFGLTLGMAATLTGWPTPMAGSKATEEYNEAGNTDSGRKTQSLFPAQTESAAAYRLNHHFSRWLMGYPEDWANCAPTVTRSSRKSALRS